MDFSWITHYWPLLLKGAEQTIALLVISVSLGFCLAVVLALLQVMGPKPLAKFSSGYCTLLRGTPLLVQIFIFYYGLPSVGIRTTTSATSITPRSLLVVDSFDLVFKRHTTSAGYFLKPSTLFTVIAISQLLSPRTPCPLGRGAA